MIEIKLDRVPKNQIPYLQGLEIHDETSNKLVNGTIMG